MRQKNSIPLLCNKRVQSLMLCSSLQNSMMHLIKSGFVLIHITSFYYQALIALIMLNLCSVQLLFVVGAVMRSLNMDVASHSVTQVSTAGPMSSPLSYLSSFFQSVSYFQSKCFQILELSGICLVCYSLIGYSAFMCRLRLHQLSGDTAQYTKVPSSLLSTPL